MPLPRSPFTVRGYSAAAFDSYVSNRTRTLWRPKPSEHELPRAHIASAVPYVSGQPQNPLACTPALGRNPRTDALSFILAAHRWLPGQGLPHPHFPSPSFPRPFRGRHGLGHGTGPFGFTRYHQTRFRRALMDDKGGPRRGLDLLGRTSTQPFGRMLGGVR